MQSVVTMQRQVPVCLVISEAALEAQAHIALRCRAMQQRKAQPPEALQRKHGQAFAAGHAFSS